MKLKHILIALILSSLLPTAAVAYDMEKNTDIWPYEGVYQVRYSRVVNAGISSYIFQDSLFISLNELLSLLAIDNDYDYNTKVLTGFVTHPDSTFTIDFGGNIANMVENELTFDSLSYILNNLQIYMTPDLISRVFGIEIRISNTELTLAITSSKELPVLENYQRNKKYKSIDQIQNGIDYYPLMFDRERHWLNGGFLEYNVGYTKTRYSKFVRYDARLGIELFGGDLTLTTQGNYSTLTSYDLFNGVFNWKYFISDNPYLNQFILGEMSTGGTNTRGAISTQFQGIQLTNTPIILNNFFEEIEVSDYVTPNADVELYINDQLANHIKTDSTGYYSFTIPIRYGRNAYSLKVFNKKGLIDEESYTRNVPSSLLREGQVIYNLNGGKIKFKDEYLVGGNISAGITSWLTNTVSVEHHQHGKEPIINNTLSLLLFNRISSNVSYNHKLFVNTNLNYDVGKWADITVSYIKYLGGENLYFKNMRESYLAGIMISDFGGIPMNFSIFGSTDHFEDNLKEYYLNKLSAKLNYNLYNVRLSTNYRINFHGFDPFADESDRRHSINFQVSYSVPGILKAIYLDDLRLKSMASYTLEPMKLRRITAGFSKKLFDMMTFNLEYGYMPMSRSTAITASLTMNLPWVKSITRGMSKSSGLTYSESLKGVIGYDSYDKEFYLSNPRQINSIGRGSAILRYYLDEDLDNEYDENEPILPDVKVKMPQASTRRMKDSPETLVYNMYGNGRYNVTLDKESLRNPLWTPSLNDFSFIAEPNSYKHLDIPCFTAGVVEGAVYKKSDSVTKAMAGIKVLIQSRDSSFSETITCFSDGNFYYMGVPPGDYTAQVEPGQLSRLNLISEPAFIEFTVKRSNDGDIISDLIFEVSANNKSHQSKKEE